MSEDSAPLSLYEIDRLVRLSSITRGAPLKFYQQVMKAEYGTRVTRKDVSTLIAVLVDNYLFVNLIDEAVRARYKLAEGRMHYKHLQFKARAEDREGGAHEPVDAPAAVAHTKPSKSQRRRANRKKRLAAQPATTSS
jgi:hypothetical protein